MGTKKIFFFFIIAAVLIRLLGLDMPLFSDESIWSAAAHQDYKFDHPPLSITVFKFVSELFGNSIAGMRLFPLIFNILSMLFIYLICKRLYDKKTVFFSIFLMAFLFHPILNSLEIADDSFFLFLSVLLFYFNFKFKNNLRLFLLGISLGLILLTRYTGILFFIIFFVYELIDKRLKKGIINSIFIFIIAILIFSIFPIINYDLFLFTLEHLFSATGGETISFLSKLIILVLWATPLLLGLTLLSLSKFKKKDILFWMWIIIGLGFNLFYMPRGDFSRYFMFILPALIILSSNYLSKIKLSKTYIYIGLFSFFFFYIILILFNLNSRIMFTHFIENYVNGAKQMMNFMFPYSISQGSWFGISFYAILFMLSFSLIFFVLIFFKKYKKTALILFISLGLSYNIFLDGEYLLHISQPNINKVFYEMVDYVNNSPVFPIYMTNKGFIDYVYSYDLFPENRENLFENKLEHRNKNEIINKINKNGGTIMLLNFDQKINKEEIDSIENCKLAKTFSDKNITVGYVYLCKK